MTARYCFWLSGTVRSRAGMERLVRSARRNGVREEFHVWGGPPVTGAFLHRCGRRRGGVRARLDDLGRRVVRLAYDYFVWLDADCCFERAPGDLLRVLEGAPIHAPLVMDVGARRGEGLEWEGCSLHNFWMLMRFCGVRSGSIYTVDDGFWVVHRDAIGTVVGLMEEFGEFCGKAGYRFGFKPLLAYAVQMLCGDARRHLWERNADLWSANAGFEAGAGGRVKPALVKVSRRAEHQTLGGALRKAELNSLKAVEE